MEIFFFRLPSLRPRVSTCSRLGIVFFIRYAVTMYIMLYYVVNSRINEFLFNFFLSGFKPESTERTNSIKRGEIDARRDVRKSEGSDETREI